MFLLRQPNFWWHNQTILWVKKKKFLFSKLLHQFKSYESRITTSCWKAPKSRYTTTHNPNLYSDRVGSLIRPRSNIVCHPRRITWWYWNLCFLSKRRCDLIGYINIITFILRLKINYLTMSILVFKIVNRNIYIRKNVCNKTFYFRREKAKPQKFTPHPWDVGALKFRIKTSNFYCRFGFSIKNIQVLFKHFF